MIRLYTAPTPNCRKVSIALEELGLSYQVERVRLDAGEQLTPAFLANPPSAEHDHARAVADRDQLERGFRRLSVEHRAVVALKYFADRTDDQIAEILEIPVGTVRSRLHHSLRRLRAELDADARSEPARGMP
jgi:RNA polymerase sigma factor (sigma-70 family)